MIRKQIIWRTADTFPVLLSLWTRVLLLKMLPLLSRFLTCFRVAGKNFSTSSALQCAPRLAGRPFLPGSDEGGFPEFLAPPRPDFPKVVDAEDVGIGNKNLTSYEIGQKYRGVVDEMLRPYPALLLRGLPLSCVEDFSQFCAGLGYDALDYVSGSGVRDKVAEGVLTASDEPPEYTIELHNEMAYSTIQVPAKIAFFCVTPPAPGCGGETAIADVRDIWRDLDKPTVQGMAEKGLRYMNYFASATSGTDAYNSWQTILQTDDKKVVEDVFDNAGYGYTWQEDDSIHYWNDKSAFDNHPLTGEKLWFNQGHCSHQSYFYEHPRFKGKNIPAQNYPFSCFYPDWSDIEPEAVQHIRCVAWHNAVGLQLMKGDIMLLDNFYVQHSRLSFTGERKLVVNLMN